ncbi:MAG: bifunctional phosphoribosylaminoimidazolecarboxamide formyltransferase/IMP cyclohydrolase [Bacteroidales bacterium]|nr:bifunctional phosphoribosylaminoimidazolecarboxamide formyltransferase/IMP cyclohydrolase [Candidatus Sodaliphilus aphodohippi]
MENLKKIKRALVSVYHKDGLEELLNTLNNNNVEFLSTGGTQSFIQGLGYKCAAVEDLTGYPSILGGRVKTLHPKVFGGILSRRDNQDDVKQTQQYEIPEIDLVIVDLYPFEETVASGCTESEIIEKIDIGGISLIRAAAKNFNDVAIVASKAQYSMLKEMMERNGGAFTSLSDRRLLAREAFAVSSYYDSHIFNYFDGEDNSALRLPINGRKSLRYGENPHQKGFYYGDFDAMFTQLHGKEISYNNLLDIDAAVNLISDFDETTFVIMKHNNACGLASRDKLVDAYRAALAGDPISAFGGVHVTNRPIDKETAEEMNKIFIEVCIAPGYSEEALEILEQKKNRIILVMKPFERPTLQCRSILNGALLQERDTHVETPEELKQASTTAATAAQIEDMLFANKIVKHSKSNSIVLAKDKTLIASGVGQTSRVDALCQAIDKAKHFEHSLEGAVMASDAFFPFGDCVEIANKAGVTAVIQPGGSVRDEESVTYCNNHGMAMVMTGIRHFKH